MYTRLGLNLLRCVNLSNALVAPSEPFTIGHTFEQVRENQ